MQITADEVHMWAIDLERTAEPSGGDPLAVLDDAERARAGRFRFEADRQRYVIAHAALREILGALLGVLPERVRYETGSHGKPRTDGLHFSMTHAGDLALVAVALDREVGIDVEPLRPSRDRESVARHFFTARECAAIEAAAPLARDAAFLACWTRKEAVAKALGLGLALSFDSFAVSLPGNEPARVLEASGEGAPAEAWSLTHVALYAGYAGALATRGTAPRLVLRQFRHEPETGRTGVQFRSSTRSP